MPNTELSDNIFPKTSSWKIQSDNGTLTDINVVNDYSATYYCSKESNYVYVSLRTASQIAGKKFKLTFDDFSSTDGGAWLYVRHYEGDNYTAIVDEERTSGAVDIEFETTSACTRLDIRMRHIYASQGCDATITISNASLREIVPVVSPTTLNFHKVQADNLPSSVTAGTEHIYFTTDGTRVRMYITNKEGALIEVTGLSSSGGGASESSNYINPYTQAHIDERKEEIVNLTKQGHCLVFAIATDIHLRIEDAGEGRYNQVRDFIMLSEQLPIDYIICEGDIMSYCQEWDGVFEPRADAVRKIFDQCRCPWYVTRGNHDYNDDDNGFQSNSNIKEYNAENADKYFISDRDWTRTITSRMPVAPYHEIHFDNAHPENGYFYVDDFQHKHRIIICNSEETMETDDGRPYIKDGQVDAYISGVETKQQIDWLIDHAMNFRDKGEDAQNWVVSFHSHTLPYSDKWIGYEGEDGELGGYKVYNAETAQATDMSEFHGYGWDNPEIRRLVHAFQNGTSINFSKTVIDVDDVNDGVTNHQWIAYERTVDFSDQGAMKVLGWFSGHCHDDCHSTVNGLNLTISTCTCSSKRTDWSLDPDPIKPAPDRNSTDKAMSVNVFVVNLDTRAINCIKVGSKRDNTLKTSSDYVMTY